MSSILKALKKLEREKSGRLPDPLNIDIDILEPSDTSKKTSPVVLILLFLMVFGAGVTAAFFFLKGARAPQPARTPVPIVAPKNLPPPSPQPVISTVTLPAEIVIAPAHPAPSGRASRKRQQKKAAAAPLSGAVQKKVAGGGVSGRRKTAHVTPRQIKTESPAGSTVPALKVDGIAFQNSSVDSMAIVNGIPVSGGSKIEGAIVEEVRKDRVLFQYNGKKFEIRLGQSNR